MTMKTERIFIIFLGVWIIVFCGIKTLQHFSFGTNACDLSIVDYGFHYTLKGEVMADPFHQYAFGRWERNQGMLTYLPGRVKGWESHFALHFTPILFLMIPLYVVFPGPLILLYIEVIAIGLSGLFLYLIARSVLKDRFLPVVVAVVYLFFRQLLLGLMHDFHTELLFPVFFLGAFYFLAIRKKPLLYFLFLSLALLVKEDVGIYLFFFGIFAVYKLKEKRLGWLTSALSLGYVLLTLGIVIPYFRQQAGGTGFYLYGAIYGQESGSLVQMIGNILRHPGILLQGVDFGLFLRILAANILLPLLFLPLASSYAVLLVPPLAVMLLSKIPQMYTFGLHYSITFLPFLFLALIYGMKNARDFLARSPTLPRLESGAKNRSPAFQGGDEKRGSGLTPNKPRHSCRGIEGLTSPAARKIRLSFFGVGLLLLLVNLANSSLWRIIQPSRYRALSSYSGVRKLIGRIPAQASVAAQSALIPHIPKRKAIAMLPAFHGEDYILTHRGVNLWPYSEEEFDNFLLTIERDPAYERIGQRGDACLFRRINGSGDKRSQFGFLGPRILIALGRTSSSIRSLRPRNSPLY
ncbi:MAG: DUF2079 domain-containing protein [Candidatus Aminicenantes bacterium]|nr:DUF2079 domain-containing protein [Candidatus Aminicenantes bacterium]